MLTKYINSQFLLTIGIFLLLQVGSASAQCSASFTQSISGRVVAFTSTSTGNYLEYHWDFGDGKTAPSSGYSHIYDSVGTYTVTLIIQDSISLCSDTVVKNITIGGPNSCKAKFSFSNNYLNASFYDNSVGINYAKLDLFWDFGDGNTSTQRKPKHTYAWGGKYYVCLIVSESSTNCSDTFCDSVEVISSLKCVARFTYSSNNLTTTFTNLSTGASPTYLWEFGDGDTSSQKNPSHTYPNSGWYPVCLWLTDTANNCVDTLCDSIYVNDDPCNINAGFSKSTSNLSASFTNTTVGADLNYTWDFGDGSSSNQKNPSHTYAVAGSYVVQLMAKYSGYSCADTTFDTVKVTAPIICNAKFNHNSNDLTATFTNTSSGAPVFNYKWDFGDSKSSSLKNPTHTYATGGHYNVCLIVTDSANTCADTFCKWVAVTKPTPLCNAKFTIYPDSTSQYLIYVQDQSTGDSTLTYQWSFGDGDSSHSQTPTHSYSTFGTFALCLKVTSGQCSSSFCDTFTLDSSGNFSTKRGFTMVVLPNGPVSVQPPVEQLNINIYPNPFSNSLRLDWEKDAAGNIEIFDAAGRSQFKQSNVQAGSEIELSELGKGIYIMQLQIGDTVQQHRLIKQ